MLVEENTPDSTGSLVTGVSGHQDKDLVTGFSSFSELMSCQEEPQIPQLTNSSKETGDEHSSERFNAR